MKITKKDLALSLERLADVSGYVLTKEQAIKEGKDFYLSLDHNSVYGGYRLCAVKVESGAEYGVFGYSGIEGRLKSSEMNIRIRGIINGIEFAKQLTK